MNIVVRGNSREFPGFLRAFISNFVDGRSPEDIEDIMDRHRFMDLTYDLMDISALTVHNFFMDLFDAIESVWMEEGPRDIRQFAGDWIDRSARIKPADVVRTVEDELASHI